MNRTMRHNKSLEYALLVMGYKMEHCFLRNNLVWKQRLKKAQIKEIASSKGMSASEWINEAIQEKIEREKNL